MSTPGTLAGLKPYPAYKDSVMPWLRQVPEHWALRRAKYFYREVDERSVTGDEELMSVSHLTGVTPRREKNVTMFLAQSNIGHKLCQPGDLVINTMWAWMAALGVARQVGLVSPSYGVYRPLASNNLLPSYADRLLRTAAYSSEYNCRSTGINSSRLRLYPDEFLRIPVLSPPESDQTAIVRFLGHVDRRIGRYIRAKQKLITLLEEQKRAIIHRAVTRGLDPSVNLRRSRVEWLGDVPKHWKELPLKRISRLDSSGSYGSELELGEEVMPVATTAQISRDGRFAVDRMPRRGFSRHDVQRYRCRPGDILVVKSSGSIFNVISGKAGIVREDTPPFIFSNFLMRIVPEYSAVEPEYLFLLLSGYLTRERVKRMVAGTTYPNLRVGEYVSAVLPVPPLPEQKAIVSAVLRETAAVERAAETAQREIDLLREYRTSLIADVVTGRLDVREAAAGLPDEADEPEAEVLAEDAGDEDVVAELLAEEEVAA